MLQVGLNYYFVVETLKLRVGPIIECGALHNVCQVSRREIVFHHKYSKVEPGGKMCTSWETCTRGSENTQIFSLID